MASEKSCPSDKYTPKYSPISSTDEDSIDTVVQDKPINFSKQNTYTTSIHHPFSYSRMRFPVLPTPNNPEPKLMNNTSDLQPRNAHIMDPSTSQGSEPLSSIVDRLIIRNRGEFLRNGNKSPPRTSQELINSWIDSTIAFASERAQTFRRLERQSTVGEISEPPFSANGRVSSKQDRKFNNTSLPKGKSARVLHQESPSENRHLMNAREQFSSGSFQGPMNHQRSISTPTANSLSGSRNGFPNAQYNRVSSNTQRRLSGEAPSFSSSSKENTSPLDPQSSNSFGEASSNYVTSSDQSSSPSFPPRPFNDLSPEDPKYSLGMGMQLQAQALVNGPLAIRPGLSITQQPTHPQNQLNGHDEDPNEASNANGRAKRRKGQPVPEEEKDEKYKEKRLKNNKAAKRSRDKRRLREQQNIAIIKNLTEDNEALLRRVAYYEEMEKRLKNPASFACNPCLTRLSSFPPFKPLSPPPPDAQ
ncbi:hypothetical protein TNIN_30841 [Trichonephila inaurata madagascariensis]|uniref:BZIP domain-containing protein n=1 Tax=Trichonephila inaurata madagascariensis TaxID=2747483 RepID=A0A8X6XYI5_9ARAC|nr:hypothetical protein TNIN_30841 [Trichonephila inaurata madagascariensis]